MATKKDKASKEPIEGVVFDVYRTERSSAIEEDAPFLSASTDSEGKAVFSKLPRDATYRIVEAESRIDLGYPTQHAEVRSIFSDGRWYSDFAPTKRKRA
ncbi:MAG: SpaA isopeptide-forming pilin-related protein [Slackia sp.]